MSKSNGVIRIGRKGLKKFAFGEEGEPYSGVFEVDVVEQFQQWRVIDDEFRQANEDRSIPIERMSEYHTAAVRFVKQLSGNNAPEGDQYDITVTEALDFLARLRECYDELADFFVPKSREERASPVTSGAELRFSVEETEN